VEGQSLPGPNAISALKYAAVAPVSHADKEVNSEQCTPRWKSQSVPTVPSSRVVENETLTDTHDQPLRLKVLKNKIKAFDDETVSISSNTTSTSRGSEERTKLFERFSIEGTKLATELSVGPEMTLGATESSEIAGPSPESTEVTPQILVRAATSLSVAVETTLSNHNQGAMQPVREFLGIPPRDSRYPTQQEQKRKATLSISSDTKTDVVFPSKIHVDVHLRFNGKSGDFSPTQFEDFEWTVPARYNELNPKRTIDRHVQAHPKLKGQKIYIRHGSCQVKGPSNMKSAGEFSKVDYMKALNQYAIRDICGFISKHPFYTPRLEVHWDFASAQLKPLPQQDFAETIQVELQKKMCRNFNGQEYIPKCDLEEFLDVSVARLLLDRDPSLNMSQEDKDEFLEKVQTLPARKLLVICVFVGFKLDKLRHLIYDHNFSDRDLPKGSTKGSGAEISNGNTKCLDADCTFKYARLWNQMNAFFPKDIKKGQKRRSLPTDRVVPVQYPDSQQRELGQGAFGVVTEVIIDRSHHSLSGVSNEPIYACMVVNNTYRTLTAFSR